MATYEGPTLANMRELFRAPSGVDRRDRRPLGVTAITATTNTASRPRPTSAASSTPARSGRRNLGTGITRQASHGRRRPILSAMTTVPCYVGERSGSIGSIRLERSIRFCSAIMTPPGQLPRECMIPMPGAPRAAELSFVIIGGVASLVSVGDRSDHRHWCSAIGNFTRLWNGLRAFSHGERLIAQEV